MKKVVFLMCSLVLTQFCFAQKRTVDYYIQLVITENNGLLNGHPIIETSTNTPLDSLINNEQINALLTKASILDALNYFSFKGWKLVSTNNVPFNSGNGVSTRCYYLLKKEIVLSKADIDKLVPYLTR